MHKEPLLFILFYLINTYYIQALGIVLYLIDDAQESQSSYFHGAYFLNRNKNANWVKPQADILKYVL